MIKSTDVKQIDLTKELINIGNEELPFSSLLLKKGVKKISSTVFSWNYEDFNGDDGIVAEGSDVDSFQKSVDAGAGENSTMILRKSVSITETAMAVSKEDVKDLFVHELNNRTIELKKNLENYLVNGKINKTDGVKPRQMAGLLSFVSAGNKISTATEITNKELKEATKKMSQKGTASSNLVLLCSYEALDSINDLFDGKVGYTGIQNEFGNVVHKINNAYGSMTPYLCPSLPAKTAVLVNMDHLQIAELRSLAYQELAKTGSSRKGFIELEASLKVASPDAIVQITSTIA